MSQRHERFEIDLAATPEEVWEMLTTEGGLASWFGTDAQIELRVGGERVVRWGETMAIEGEITDIDPPHRIRVIYTADGEETGAEEWLISGSATTTRLTLINSFDTDGIDDWEGFYGDIRRGWNLFLASLRFALEDAATPMRQVDCVYLPAPGVRAELWRLVDQVFAERPDLTSGMEPRLLDRPHSRLHVSSDRSLIVDFEGDGGHQLAYVQAATHGVPSDWRLAVIEVIRAVFAGIRG